MQQVEPEPTLDKSPEKPTEKIERTLYYEFTDRKLYIHEDGKLYWDNGVMLNRADRRNVFRIISRVYKKNKKREM